ncbi:hypothetical protein AVEN_201939-1, partial [Araneus ventricosus]
IVLSCICIEGASPILDHTEEEPLINPCGLETTYSGPEFCWNGVVVLKTLEEDARFKAKIVLSQIDDISERLAISVRWPSDKVLASRKVGQGSKPHSAQEPPCVWFTPILTSKIKRPNVGVVWRGILPLRRRPSRGSKLRCLSKTAQVLLQNGSLNLM